MQVSIKQSADLSGGGAFGKGGGNGGSNGRADASLFDPLRAKESEAWVNLIHYHAEVRKDKVATLFRCRLSSRMLTWFLCLRRTDSTVKHRI